MADRRRFAEGVVTADQFVGAMRHRAAAFRAFNACCGQRESKQDAVKVTPLQRMRRAAFARAFWTGPSSSSACARRARGGARGQDAALGRAGRNGVPCPRCRRLLARRRTSSASPPSPARKPRSPRLQDASARGGVPPVARTRGGGEARRPRRLPLERRTVRTRSRAGPRSPRLPSRGAPPRGELAARLGRVPRVAAGVRLPRRAAPPSARCGRRQALFPLPRGNRVGGRPSPARRSRWYRRARLGRGPRARRAVRGGGVLSGGPGLLGASRLAVARARGEPAPRGPRGRMRAVLEQRSARESWTPGASSRSGPPRAGHRPPRRRASAGTRDWRRLCTGGAPRRRRRSPRGGRRSRGRVRAESVKTTVSARPSSRRSPSSARRFGRTTSLPRRSRRGTGTRASYKTSRTSRRRRFLGALCPRQTAERASAKG